MSIPDINKWLKVHAFEPNRLEIYSALSITAYDRLVWTPVFKMVQWGQWTCKTVVEKKNEIKPIKFLSLSTCSISETITLMAKEKIKIPWWGILYGKMAQEAWYTLKNEILRTQLQMLPLRRRRSS